MTRATLFVLLPILLINLMPAVIGLTTMVGWTLGTVEAILISILAGFSVDYVVHLAHAYSHSYGTVNERIVATFSEMGSPVFSGMCTSVLASLPLFACNLQFFSKFGTFLCLTIVFSWVRNSGVAPPEQLAHGYALNHYIAATCTREPVSVLLLASLRL